MFTFINLISLLELFDIPVEQFGTGKAKRIEDLFNEIKNGDCELIISKDGICRKVSVVRAWVTRDDQILIEDYQLFNDGQKRERNLDHLSEKIHSGEDPATALERAFAEELDIHSSIIHMGGDTETETNDSPSYPGLKSTYIFHDFNVTLTKEQYKEEGYIEEEENTGIKTYFKWISNLGF